jgi:hypothetical protein
LKTRVTTRRHRTVVAGDGENGRKLLDVPSQSLVVNLSGRELSTEIIESCRSGDRDAFRALYDLYKNRVYSMALYFFHGDPAVASDVTQQVFLKLMTSIRQYRGEAEFSTWLVKDVPCRLPWDCNVSITFEGSP